MYTSRTGYGLAVAVATATQALTSCAWVAVQGNRTPWAVAGGHDRTTFALILTIQPYKATQSIVVLGLSGCDEQAEKCIQLNKRQTKLKWSWVLVKIMEHQNLLSTKSENAFW